jgi:DNA-binding response OmpR family regulator
MSEVRRRGSDVPAIMMTATVNRALQRLAAELGIKRVLEKPFANQAPARVRALIKL